MSGFRAGSQYTVEPQLGQKWNTTRDPLSELRLKSLLSPSTSTRSRRKKADNPKALPVRRRQSSPWQIDTLTGWPSHFTRS
jgi:hypothetical protein